MIDEKIRARVLKVEDGVVTLGVHLMGAWQRIHARTEVPLEPMSWIQGHLTVPSDGSMVILRVSKQEPSPSEDEAAPHVKDHPGSLDLEA